MDDPNLQEIIYPSKEPPEAPDGDLRLRVFETRRAYSQRTACRLSLQSNSTAYKTIANILLNNRDSEQPGNEQQRSFSLIAHENLRGSTAYKKHLYTSLNDYFLYEQKTYARTTQRT